MQIRGAEALQIPVVVTEQYPKALGNTVEEIQAVLPAGSLIQDKFDFTMCGTSLPMHTWTAFTAAVRKLLTHTILLLQCSLSNSSLNGTSLCGRFCCWVSPVRHNMHLNCRFCIQFVTRCMCRH